MQRPRWYHDGNASFSNSGTFQNASTTTANATFLVSDLISIRGGVLRGTGDLTTAVLQMEAGATIQSGSSA